MTNDNSEPYLLYIGAASANPGSSACAALFVRAGRVFDLSKKFDNSIFDMMLVEGLSLGLTALAKKTGPVVVVADRQSILQADCESIEPTTDSWSAIRSVWQAFLQTRLDKSAASIRWFDKDSKSDLERLGRVNQIAYLAAFPEGIWAPAYKPERALRP